MKTCYQCPDRFVGCHSQCQPYIDHKKIIDDRNEKILKEKLKHRDADAFTGMVIQRQNRKSNYKL